MSWFSKNPEAEALAEEYGQLSRHAARLQAEVDNLKAELSYADSKSEVAQIERDLAFWRSEAARLSVATKNELTYINAVTESLRVQRAELDRLVNEARSDGFRRGWLHGLDELEDTLSYYKLEAHRAKANAYDPDDDWFIPDPAADDDDSTPA